MHRQKKNDTGNFNRGECLGSPNNGYGSEIKPTFFTGVNKLVIASFLSQTKCFMVSRTMDPT